MSYSPTVGRFLQRDPLGYVDGGSLYEYVRSSPLLATDAKGTQTTIVHGSGPGSFNSGLPYWDMGTGIVYIPPMEDPSQYPKPWNMPTAQDLQDAFVGIFSGKPGFIECMAKCVGEWDYLAKLTDGIGAGSLLVLGYFPKSLLGGLGGKSIGAVPTLIKTYLGLSAKGTFGGTLVLASNTCTKFVTGPVQIGYGSYLAVVEIGCAIKCAV